MMMIRNSAGRLYPADKVTFAIVNDPRGTGNVVSVRPRPGDPGAGAGSSERALFYPGGSDTGIEIPGNDDADNRPVLGYIGKSGRFVAITNN